VGNPWFHSSFLGSQKEILKKGKNSGERKTVGLSFPLGTE